MLLILLLIRMNDNRVLTNIMILNESIYLYTYYHLNLIYNDIKDTYIIKYYIMGNLILSMVYIKIY